MQPHTGLSGTLPPVRRMILDLVLRCRAMSLPARVLLGLVAAATAVLIRVELLTGLLGNQNPYVTLIVMVPLVAMLAGFAAGATTIVCGALLAHLLVRWPVAANDYILLCIFIMSSGIIAALIEVTHRVHSRAQQTAASAARVEIYTTFITQAPVAIAMLDRDMRYLAASELWIKLFSNAQRDVVGQSHYDLFPDLPQH